MLGSHLGEVNTLPARETCLCLLLVNSLCPYYFIPFMSISSDFIDVIIVSICHVEREDISATVVYGRGS